MHKIFVLIIANIISVSIALTQSENIEALKYFYYSTNGSLWRYPQNVVKWNFSSSVVDPCSMKWAGVTCNQNADKCLYRSCTVTNLSLSGFNMKGMIPPQFGKLTNLTFVDLSNNSLSGNLFDIFRPLIKLYQFYVNENSFTGTIPAWIANHFTNLNLMSLRSNRFHGTIPTQIGLISSNIVEMHFSLNFFTGTIPSTYGQLSTLTYLSLRNNFLGGTVPFQLGELYQLIQLSLYENNLVGTIPSSFGNFSSMRFLYIHTNHFSGTFPLQFSNLLNIDSLYLFKNQFTGILPSFVCTWSNTTSINFGQNSFYGSIPPCISRLTKLIEFDMSLNSLTGRMNSVDWSPFKKLRNLTLAYNFLTGTLPNTLIGLRSISILTLRGNYIFGNLFSIRTSVYPICVNFDFKS